MTSSKGLSMKSQRDVQYGQGGFFRCGRPHLLVKKKIWMLRNLWCVNTDKGGGQGESFSLTVQLTVILQLHLNFGLQCDLFLIYSYKWFRFIYKLTVTLHL